MDNVSGSAGTRGRWLIIGGFALLGVILIVAAAVAVWQASAHSSRVEDVESRTTTVSLLRNVEEESGLAATLLQQYVEEGDHSLIPEIQSHSDAAMGSLMEAAALSETAAVDEISVDGARLNEGAGQIVSLRLTGDVQGAAAALEEVSPAFEEFNLAFAQVIEQELREADALQGRADEADDLATRSLAVAAAAGATLGFVTLACRSCSRMGRTPTSTAST